MVDFILVTEHTWPWKCDRPHGKVQNDVYNIIDETVQEEEDSIIWVISEDQVQSINNEIPEAQNEVENCDHEEHTEDENLDHEEHTEDDLAPRNETNLTPVTVFSQTQPSQNLWYSN